MKKCKTNRRLVKCIFLGLITLGIYNLAVSVRLGSDLNRVQKQLGIPGKKVMNFIGACFLSIITLGIPLFIWSIRVPNRVYLYADKAGVQKRGSCKSFFLVSILLCWTIIGPLIVMSKLLKTANNVCKWYNDQIEAPAQPVEQPMEQIAGGEEQPANQDEIPSQFEGLEEPKEEIEVLDLKEAPKEQPKEEPKEQPAPEQPKEEPKEQPAPEQPKEEPKMEDFELEEEPKEEPKEEQQPAEEPKEQPVAAKKAEPVKKEPAKKPAPAPKKEPAKKEEPKKGPSANAAYHVSKRASDGKWQVFIAGSDKVIKLFNTKVEAEEWVNEKAESTGRTVLVHASKGKSKGKIQK